MNRINNADAVNQVVSELLASATNGIRSGVSRVNEIRRKATNQVEPTNQGDLDVVPNFRNLVNRRNAGHQNGQNEGNQNVNHVW